MVLPTSKHWFGSSAWVALLPTVLTGLLGVIALPAGLATYHFWTLALFAVLASLLVWWNAAQQAKRADEDRRVVNDLAARLSARTEPPARAAVEDLRRLSSDELRERVRQISQRMRKMEQTFQDSRDRLIRDRRLMADWEAHTSRLISLSNEQTNRWRIECQPQAVSLWEELQRRLYGAPPYPEDKRATVALESGMLAGVAPLNEAALALETLARQLP